MTIKVEQAFNGDVSVILSDGQYERMKPEDAHELFEALDEVLFDVPYWERMEEIEERIRLARARLHDVHDALGDEDDEQPD